MNMQIEAGLRVTVSAMLAVVLTTAVLGGIGGDVRAAALRVAAAEARLADQWAAVVGGPAASQVDATTHAG